MLLLLVLRGFHWSTTKSTSTKRIIGVFLLRSRQTGWLYNTRILVASPPTGHRSSTDFEHHVFGNNIYTYLLLIVINNNADSGRRDDDDETGRFITTTWNRSGDISVGPPHVRRVRRLSFHPKVSYDSIPLVGTFTSRAFSEFSRRVSRTGNFHRASSSLVKHYTRVERYKQ